MSARSRVAAHQAALRDGATVTEIVAATLERCDEVQQRSNAFASVLHRHALDEAARLDARSPGERSVLHGAPVTVKDLYVVDGATTRAGTRAPLPPLGREGRLVRRLRGAGAVVVATTNTHEVALGLTGENPTTGDVANPWDPRRQAGGSSGGSAAAIAGGVGVASLGTDTAGSIRLPAAHCGVVGLRPTPGLLPLDGLLPLSPSLDVAGPLVGSVADARAVLAVLSGDPRVADTTLPSQLVVAVARGLHDSLLTDATVAALDDLAGALREAACRVVDVDLSVVSDGPSTHGDVCLPEAHLVHRSALQTEPSAFGAEVRALLERGARVTAVDHLLAQRRRTRMRAQISGALDAVGACALVCPTSPGPAPLRGTGVMPTGRGPTPTRAALLGLLTPFSLAGLPTVAVPTGTVVPDDDPTVAMPIGVQVVGHVGDDATVLAVAEVVESVSPPVGPLP